MPIKTHEEHANDQLGTKYSLFLLLLCFFGLNLC